MGGPLDGFRVVELAEGIAGPACAMQLGDAGADVIKVEPPAGDRARGWGSRRQGTAGAAFNALNRNKRGIALDLGSAGGQEAMQALLARADVAVVDASRAADAGLDYETAGALNPRLVYCVISGYGARGPWADRPAGELPAQLASEATASLGRIGDPPVRLGTDAANMYAAAYAVQAVCAALLACDRLGSGQRVEVSLFGSLLAMRSTLWVALSNPDEWWGFHLDSYVKPPDHGYRCADGAIYFQLTRMPRGNFDALLHDLGMEWAREDPLFPLLKSDMAGGTARYAYVVRPLWERGFARFGAKELIALVERHGGLAFPMNDYDMLVNDPQARHLGIVQSVTGPAGRVMQTITPPWQFSETPAAIRLPPPRLGEHGRDILAELGYARHEINALINGSDG